MSEDAPATPDLSALTFDELADELQRRCDGLLILAEMDRTDSETQYVIRYAGGASRVVGMAQRFLWRIQDRERFDEPPERDEPC